MPLYVCQEGFHCNCGDYQRGAPCCFCGGRPVEDSEDDGGDDGSEENLPEELMGKYGRL